MRELFKGKFKDVTFGDTSHDSLGRVWARPDYVQESEIVIVELPPQRRLIRINCGQLLETVNVPLPYLQSLFFFDAIAVAASSSPHKLGRHFCFSPFSNVYESGMCCQEKAKNVIDAITIFFGSSFDPPSHWKPSMIFAKNYLDLPWSNSPTTYYREFCHRWSALEIDDMLKVKWKELGKWGRELSDEYPSELGNVYPLFFHIVTRNSVPAITRHFM